MIRTLVLACAAAALARAETIEVSPGGPIRSLEAARDAVRALRGRATGPITVLVRGGVYRLERTFVLGPEDSGTAERPVVYAAAPGETVSICGGRVITGLARKGPNWTVEIPEVKEGRWYFRQLFVGGERAVRARTPNNGFYRAEGPSSQDKPFQVKFRGTEIRASWAALGDVEVVSLLAWSELRSPIAKVDAEARIATLMTDPRRSNKEVEARFFIENAPEALDAPGEWYLDRRTGVLSYRAASGEDVAKAEITAPVLTQLVRLEGRPERGEYVHHVTFRGLRFCHADWTMDAAGFADSQAASTAPSAIEVHGAEDCAFERCQIAHSGGYGLWFGRGARRNRVASSEIYDMGAGGVKIGEITQRRAEGEQSFENAVTDSHLHHLGAVYPSAHGVWVAQSGRTTIAHNHIHDLSYTAIAVGWTWGYGPNQSQGNRIEYNHLHHIGGQSVMSDLACIYTLGVQPGTVIRNNLCHDIDSFTYGGWGIYPDEGSSEMIVENNIAYRCKSAGFHQHYGRENRVRNNIFALNRQYQLMRTRVEPHISFFFEGNIVYWDEGRPLGSNWTGENFKMNRNIYWDARGGPVQFAGKSFAEWQQSGQDKDSLLADPLFVDAGNFDFRLRPDSPALKLGFRQIDMRTVGPRP
jgi:parallel beta-helix repeat protein